jgi:ribonuclease D
MRLIENNQEIAGFCASLTGEDFVTVDTEFLREKTYYPILCLVQIASSKEAVAIDPLAPGADLQPVFDVMADTSIIKVFHSARQDLEIFLNLTNTLPAPLFDSQVAAMVCGFGESVGYEALVNNLLSEQVDKSSRYTDWSRRPLTDQQIDYAISDVTHLRVIYEIFRDRLAESGRSSWLEEEMSILSSVDTYRPDPMDAWKKLKPRSNKPKFLLALQAVAAWRELEARKRDTTKNRLMRDDTLTELAATLPTSFEQLTKVRGLNSSIVKRDQGAEFLKVIRDAARKNPDEAPSLPKKPDNKDRNDSLMELLKVLLKAKADSHKVASKLIANSKDLEKMASGQREGLSFTEGWRRQVFGEDALALCEGKTALTVNGDKIVIIPLP